MNFLGELVNGIFGGEKAPEPMPLDQRTGLQAGEIDKSTQANRYDISNSGGTSTWTQDPITGKWTATQAMNPADQALLEGTQGLHGSSADLASALIASRGGSMGAGNGPPPAYINGPTVLNIDPKTALDYFTSHAVIPGNDLAGLGGSTPTTQPGTDTPGDTGGGSGMQSGTGTQGVTDAQGNPVMGESFGNSNNSAYLQAMGVKPAVSMLDFQAWQSLHPGDPMPAGWTMESMLGSGSGIGGGSMPQYKAGTLGQTAGAAPTLGQVGSAETMGRMTGDIPQGQTVGQGPQGQTVTQAQALARLQSPEAIAAYTGNTPVGAYQGGGNIASYNAAAPKMGTTAAPGAQQQFTGQAPTAQMIANGGSVAGAGEGIMKNLDLSNLGAMPTASEATLKQVQDALYARQTGYLDPQFQAEQAQLNARLANQGIGVGARANTLSQAAEAAAREKAYAGARNDAIIGGGAEQSRLFNMQMAARQQGYTEDLGQGAFQNAAQGQGYAQQLANQQNVIQGTTANNAAQNAQLAAQMAIMQQNNAAKQTDFTNQFNITGQNNAAQQALGQYNLGAGTLNANIGNMNAQNALGAGQLNANIGIANNAANLGAGQLNAQISQNNFANNLATAGFNNAAIQGDITNQLATTGFNNQVGQQGFQNQLAATGFNNQVGQQGFTNQLAQNTFNNQAAQQDYANQLAGQGFNNTALNQGYQNQLAGLGFNNAVGQQDVANQFSQQGLNINSAQAAAQMAAAKASAANAAGSSAAAIARNNQLHSEWQSEFNAGLTQKSFDNWMTINNFNQGATNDANSFGINSFNAGVNADNSNVTNLSKFIDMSGPVTNPPPIGGANYTVPTVNAIGAAQDVYADQVNKTNSDNSTLDAVLGAFGNLGGALIMRPTPKG